ncbi:MAG: tRNA (guanosine(37)-N1)-methyltransferase TrmD [Eubacteriales bacterium]|nr:tRNA (guanosine(37)-N1)-methyltransferase TrmD [Eubacteriales bacterium]
MNKSGSQASEFKIYVLSLFPDLISGALSHSITGRAIAEDRVDLRLINIRDYGIGRYKKVDDRLYGGGTGMLMRADVLANCLEDLRAQGLNLESAARYYLSPRGRVFKQQEAKCWAAKKQDLVFLCGHYEGVDQRFLDYYDFEEISLGDFVLTGGEIAVATMLDALIRLLPVVLPTRSAFEHESHYQAQLEEAQFTMPEKWRELEVPEVLRSGHHANIETYRAMNSLEVTMRQRPDLFDQIEFDEQTLADFSRYLLSKET